MIKKIKIFILIMLLLSIILMVISFVRKDYLTGFTDIALAITWLLEYLGLNSKGI